MDVKSLRQSVCNLPDPSILCQRSEPRRSRCLHVPYIGTSSDPETVVTLTLIVNPFIELENLRVTRVDNLL